jgi:hypothetical protein
MLMGLQGTSAASLYRDYVVRHRDEAVARAGAGVFLFGGNSVYYTAKGTADDVARQVHAVLRGHLDDLAGHHVVLKVLEGFPDQVSPFSQYMHVDRLPLTSMPPSGHSSGSADPAASLYSFSRAGSRTTWSQSLGDGWLRNLGPTMRAEQIQYRVDELHPATADGLSGTSGRRERTWSCPLLRISFWTKVSRSFSPLVPSPARTARMFGNAARQMTHGTRSHPTQMLASLYDKLADVSTSNGFCYCVDVEDCMVPSDSAVNRECTLIETIRSMYDQKFRTSRLLTKNDQVTALSDTK